MSQFNTNIDEVNHRVNALEAKFGIAKSEWIGNLDAANARVAELESRQQPKPQPPQPRAAAENKTAARPRLIHEHYKSGKATGLFKAMGAAVEKAQRKS